VRSAEFGVRSKGKGKAVAPSVTIIPAMRSEAPKIYNVTLLCDTPDLRTKGLQGFRQLEQDEAALFVFERTGPVSFWMGSVTFPIDIIFIGPDSKVGRVYPFCKPASLDVYPSIGSVKWVIETAAGSGISVGDSVKFSSELGARSAE
ncbi:MAG: hypothetical protein A2078_14280, partial [Nitrospirae bacterium GWC2_57_9]